MYVDVTINQSFAGAAHRFFTTGWSIANGQLNGFLQQENPPAEGSKARGLCLGIRLVGRRRLGHGPPLHRPSDARTAGLESALVMILMLLLSPMSHKTHFGILILPGFFVARMAIEQRDRIAAWCMLACVILIGLLDHLLLHGPGRRAGMVRQRHVGCDPLGIACFHSLAVKSKAAVRNPKTARR